MSVQVAPSMLAADFMHLEKDVRMVNECGDIFHLDIMDGTLVPNISFGFSVIDQLCKLAERPMDAHLMTVHPERWFEKLKSDGVQMVSFHWEAAKCRTSKYIEKLHSLGIKAGVAIDPDVPVKKLFPYIGKADYFLIMSVFAGFGGQKFIYESIDRVAALKTEIERRGAEALIEVDGGVTLENVSSLREAGVNLIVAGSTIFRSKDPAAAIKGLRGF
ncbi:MAG: ribulose-phosphate 3-epimerase [Bacteroidales bacterium]|nr:ribulose-phosphate 3-epimerase [Bacteroidales bacterium]